MIAGGKLEIDAPSQVEFTNSRFTLRLPLTRSTAVVTVRLDDTRQKNIAVDCTGARGPSAAIYRGAALAFILEEKQDLGLAAAPADDHPFELLNEQQLIERALQEEEPMEINTTDPAVPWTDYVVTSKLSGKTYRVAIRGMNRGDSYCTCADFRTNTLGTCKHVMKVQAKIRRKFSTRKLKRPYQQDEYAVAVCYTGAPAPRLLTPAEAPPPSPGPRPA